jgi:hypothetical protein
MIPLVARRESVSVEGRVSVIGALWPRAEAALADAVPNIQIYLCRTVVPALFALYAGAGEDGEIGKLIDTLRYANEVGAARRKSGACAERNVCGAKRVRSGAKGREQRGQKKRSEQRDKNGPQ